VNYDRLELLNRLAAEYVLGTLRGGARRRFVAVQRDNARARRVVLAWQERLHPLALALPAVEPRKQVWTNIETALGFIADKQDDTLSTGKLNWRKIFSWGAGFGISAVAGVLLSLAVLLSNPGLLGLEPKTDGLPASYVGLLTNSEGKAAVLASSRRQGKLLSVKVLAPFVVPAGSVAQLWALPAQGAPFAVGTVPASGKGSIVLNDSAEKLFSNVQRLGVTIEPAAVAQGAPPAALPQAFVLTGHCTKLW
jgi:anti-sigma-K factor RskA